MFYLTLKSLLLPPGFFILLGTAGLVLAGRWPKMSRVLLVVMLVLLYLASTGYVADRASDWIEPRAALTETAAAAWGAQAIVVLGAARAEAAPEYGGQDTVGPDLLVRLRYAASLQRRTGLPLLVTGGVGYDERVPEAELMAQVLRQSFGVKAVWLEGRSLTTWENAVYSKPLLEAAGVHRVLLVTQAFHMARAVACFERVGLEVLAAPTGFARRADGDVDYRAFLPSVAALALNTRVLHEVLGTWYYRLRHLG